MEKLCYCVKREARVVAMTILKDNRAAYPYISQCIYGGTDFFIDAEEIVTETEGVDKSNAEVGIRLRVGIEFHVFRGKITHHLSLIVVNEAGEKQEVSCLRYFSGVQQSLNIPSVGELLKTASRRGFATAIVICVMTAFDRLDETIRATLAADKDSALEKASEAN